MENAWIAWLGVAFVFLSSVLGAGIVFCFKAEIPQRTQRFLLALASGVMISASVWSLLIPSIKQASGFGVFAFVPAVVGVELGGLFLFIIDAFLPSKTVNTGEQAKALRLFFAITLHNVPEGLAVGFAFGMASVVGTTAAYLSALGLAIGIGVQNFPESAAIALPLKTAFGDKRRAFLWGVASALAEPVFAVFGYFLSAGVAILQPWLLAFAAGAMLLVTIEDLLPDVICTKSVLSSWGFLLGFMAMMVLDVTIG